MSSEPWTLPRPFTALRYVPRAIEVAGASALAYRPIRPGVDVNLDRPLVVSLTSYPARFKTLSRTIRTLLNQSATPQQLVLWIARDDLSELPAAVLKYKRSGLEIRTCPDYRSLKKLVPSLKAFPDAYIVTADDDLFYPRDWLQRLVAAAEEGTRDIVARMVYRPAFKGNQLAPVGDWDLNYCGRDSENGGAFMFASGAGVLFPPHSLDPRILDFELFDRICATCDDTWIAWMAHLAGTKIRRAPGRKARLIAWEGTYSTSLSDINFGNGAVVQNRMVEAMVEKFGVPKALETLRAGLGR